MNADDINSSSPLPVRATGASMKVLAGDPRTTNILLFAIVLCMAGLMPDSLSVLCGA